jgi:hypothetical protein
MNNRTAINTIKGYFYQFDYSIKRILESSDYTDSIVVEGIEDIDVNTATEKTAIQCKYYSRTNYSNSVIAKPIRYMVSHFVTEKRNGKNPIKYLLYGYFKTGHNKLALPLTLESLKNNFLTYTEKEKKQYHHINIGATDAELQEFLSYLEIDIKAQEYESQLTSLIDLLKKEFSCNDFEAEFYYYNNALSVIKKIAIETDVHNRKISKADFLKKINSKSILFNIWFLEYKGQKALFRKLKSEYFTNLNTSPFDRFFLIEVDRSNYKRAELKELILIISKKWSKISRRESHPFCPYIFIYAIDNTELIELKRELSDEDFFFLDGFPFQGANFNVKSLLIQPNYNNQISIKFINEISHLNEVLKESRKTKEIYQFYMNEPFYENDTPNLKHIKIQIKELKNIKEII